MALFAGFNLPELAFSTQPALTRPPVEHSNAQLSRRDGQPQCKFQAGHAGSIPVTSSSSSGIYFERFLPCLPRARVPDRLAVVPGLVFVESVFVLLAFLASAK